VSGSDLLKFKSIIPDDKVVQAFNEVMETLIESIMSNHEQAQVLGELRDTLLPRLISGQLSVNQDSLESEA
jgi:type I restriction enzyme S subunit